MMKNSLILPIVIILSAASPALAEGPNAPVAITTPGLSGRTPTAPVRPQNPSQQPGSGGGQLSFGGDTNDSQFSLSCGQQAKKPKKSGKHGQRCRQVKFSRTGNLNPVKPKPTSQY
jgi:hypothetical protein